MVLSFMRVFPCLVEGVRWKVNHNRSRWPSVVFVGQPRGSCPGGPGIASVRGLFHAQERFDGFLLVTLATEASLLAQVTATPVMFWPC